jgi:hypothetical protein
VSFWCLYPMKPFIWSHEITLKQKPCIEGHRNPDEDAAMNTIVANALRHEAARAQAATQPFSVVVLFSAVGLLASLCMLSFGFDVSGGVF